MIGEFATALMFLGRVPVFGFGSADPAVLARSTRWFPLIGLLFGAIIGLALLLATAVMPAAVATVLALLVGVLLTGAFHEDGLADVADSAGAFGIDDKLRIMRDSRVGTYGALALILLVMAKFTLLSSLVSASGATGILLPAVMAAHVASRWSSVWLMARFEYARPEAANRVVAEGVTGRRLIEASLVAVICLLVVAWLLAMAGAEVVGLLFGTAMVVICLVELTGRRVGKTLGGITGDVLGAANQLVEIAVLLVFVIAFAGPACGPTCGSVGGS